MVFFNYATMQMAAKIVFYGPGLCGKTTNLHYVYQKTSSQSRGEMVSLETETDRTLFFDLLPLDVGVIGGFKTRLQLYTVPGQVFYNTTRKLVLKGADGMVFVADSQKAMIDANIESLGNLRENLAEIGIDIDETPLVFQLNKRDLPNILPKEELQRALDPEGVRDFVEASAVSGDGVFETLKLISKLTLKNLRTRMMGEEPSPKSKIAPIVREKRPKVGSRTEPIEAIPEIPVAVTPAPAPDPSPPPPASAAASTSSAATAVALETATEVAIAPPAVTGTTEAAPEPEHRPPVKTVKVRSGVDVMAELDALRKRATQGSRPRDRSSSADLVGTSRRPVRSVLVKASAEGASDAKQFRIVIQMEDGQGGVLQSQEEIIEVGGQKRHQLTLRFDLGSDD